MHMRILKSILKENLRISLDIKSIPTKTVQQLVYIIYRLEIALEITCLKHNAIHGELHESRG